MTTLSKEDVVRALEALESMDDFARMDIGVDPIGPYKVLREFIETRAGLVAENERLKRSNSSYANLTKAQEGQLASLHLRLYELKGADKSIDSERAANATLTEELATTRTALAAAEADNERLRKFVDEVAKQTPEKPDYWSSCSQCEHNSSEADDLITQPRDDSALREMIAGVYGKCAKVADLFEEKADALNDSIADDDDANEVCSEYLMGKATASSRIANAIRALAEKSRHGS